MFRSIGKSKIAFILAILFGISLFFFKGGSRYSNLLNSDSVIASVSGTPISPSKFNRVMQLNIDKFNNILGRNLSGDEIRSLQIHSMALGALINDAVFENEYKNIGLLIDEKVIAQNTKERIPQLYNNDNKLNDLALKNFLQEQRLKIDDVVQIIEFETKDNFFTNAFFNISYPKYFSNIIGNYNNHQRKISSITLPIKQINLENNNYSENTLKEFYNTNISDYMSDESRDIDYILIKKSSFENIFIPSDYEIETYYSENKQLFFEDEKRSFMQFNFKSIEEANDFKKKINLLKFNEILSYAETNNIFFNEFKDLKSNDILKEISDPLFKLNLNEKSDIIQSSLAKHIVILKSIKKSKQLELNEVQKEIEKTIINVETNNYYNDLINNISEEIINGKTISEIANKFNLNKNTLEKITKNSNSTNNIDKKLFDELLLFGFESSKDFVSDIKNLSEDSSYLYNVNTITEPKAIKYDIVKDRLINDWKNNQKLKLIDSHYQKNNQNQLYISEVSDKFNIKIEELIIDKNYNELPSGFLNKIFESEKNQNIKIFHDDKVYIAKILDVIISKNSNNTNEISLKNDLREIFNEEVKKDKNISINDNLVRALIDQY